MTSTTCRCLLLLAVGLGFTGAPRARGCGPDFPNAYLANSVDELSTLPALSFESELERILSSPRSAPESPDEQTARLAAAERAEIRDALVRVGLPNGAMRAALEAYRRDQPPPKLPREFQLYAQGARAWHRQRTEEALAAWRELLLLPPSDRRYRTVWAFYMIGRARCDVAPREAIEAFGMAEAAASQGFADSQELAAASIGWKARAYLRDRDYAEALRLYLRQFTHGESSALASIQWMLQRVFRGESLDSGDREDDAGGDRTPADDAALRSLASDVKLRAVVTAWFAARGGPGWGWGGDAGGLFRRWVSSLPSDGKLLPEEADRWCWVAYQNGLWKDAGDLAAQAPAHAPASEWVRAMLLLRAGFVSDAAMHLSTAARSFATDAALTHSPECADERVYARYERQPLGDSPLAQLSGVRAVLALQTQQYVEALRIFMRAQHYADAAYVAERVLTIEELTAYVRAEEPIDRRAPPLIDRVEALDLRHLLARRLVRANRFDQATEFFPAGLRSDYRKYVECVRIGWNSAQPARSRADALWTAAQLMHEHGMEFQGTELEPDFAICDGEFTWPALGALRGGEAQNAAFRADGPRWKSPRDGDPVGVSPGEIARLEASRIPTARFHYRYRAAELGALAAALLPNDDEQTAIVLHTAGCWLAYRDPDFALSYYRTLVLRCPNTSLGRRAAERHWFVRD